MCSNAAAQLPKYALRCCGTRRHRGTSPTTMCSICQRVPGYTSRSRRTTRCARASLPHVCAGAYTDVFTGRQKLAFARRLGNDWQKLADYFEIPIDQRQSFTPGRRPEGVWEWLEARQRLRELRDALRYIGREDSVVELLAPPAMPAPPGVTWQGSPFPGLRHFTPDDAAIFFGRHQESTELLTRVQHERFVAVVGASGSGKSSLVAAGVLPRLHEIP